MKKVMLTMVIASVFATGIVYDADAWIFSRKNSTTMAELTENFGNNFVTKDYTDSKSYAVYSAFKDLRSKYKTIKKANNFSGDEEKVFSNFLEYMEKALIDIYQSEKSATLLKKATKVTSYYNANMNDIDEFLENNLKGTQFDTYLRKLNVPQLQTEEANGEIAEATKEVLDIITEMKKLMTAEEEAAAAAAQAPQQVAVQNGGRSGQSVSMGRSGQTVSKGRGRR